MVVFFGPLITPRNPYHCQYLPRALLYVKDGIIQWLEEDVAMEDLSNLLITHGLEQDSDIIRLAHGQFLMPGFIDTHTVRY